MKTLKAFWNWLRGIDNKVAESMKDPINERKLAIQDAKKAAENFKTALATSMSQIAVMEAELSKLREESKKYERLAQIAVGKGNDVDATKLLTEQEKVDKKIAQLDIDLEKEQQFILKNRQLLEKENEKINEVESKTERLESRSKAAENRKKLSSLRGSEAFNALDKFEDDVLATEAFSEAIDDLNSNPTDDLEIKYSEAASSESVQEKLARLKNKTNETKATV